MLSNSFKISVNLLMICYFYYNNVKYNDDDCGDGDSKHEGNNMFVENYFRYI